MKNRKNKKKWIGLAAALLICLTATAGCGGAGSEINVTTARVKTDGALADTVYTGTVKARSMEEVTADVSGKVAEISVKEGQSVKAGDILFRLDATEYVLQANQAEAALSAAQAALSGAQASQSSEAAVIPAKTASADARANYERMKLLYDAGGISQAEFEAARSKMETADAQLEAAKISQKSAADSAAAQVESARAAYELAARRVLDCEVKAPIDGQVSQIKIENGSVISAQTAAMSVVDNSSLKIGVEVLEKDVERVSEGMPAQVNVQSLGAACSGAVFEVAPSADEKTGMFLVTVAFDAGDSGVRSGMTADVRLTGSAGGQEAEPDGQNARNAGTALYVPEKSVKTEEGTSFVYVVRDGKASRREVAIGVRKNQYVEVTGGLTEEDEVIVQAGGELSDGAKVTVIKN